jgi:type I restriction enzyme M protein
VSKSVITLLLESVWPTSFFGGRVGIFLLQMLAWDKLDREGMLPKGLSLSSPEEQPQGLEFLRRGLTYLSDMSDLGEATAAFRHELRIPEELSEDELRRIFWVLKNARWQEIDYREAIDVFTRLEGRGTLFANIPEEIADLMVQLAEVKPEDTVYCPFSGSLRLAEWSNQVTRKVYFEGKERTPLPHLINILLNGSLSIRLGDPIAQPNWTEGGNLRLFDVSLASPPFGAKYQQNTASDFYNRFPERTMYGEVLHIRHVLAQTRRRAVILIPNSLLFRTTAVERQFKADLVNSSVLTAVIGLPRGLLSSTNIACSLLVLDKAEPSDTLFFVDASSEHFYEFQWGRGVSDSGGRLLKNVDEIVRICQQQDTYIYGHQATWDECEANDYNLLADRYVASSEEIRLQVLLNESEEVRELSEVADFFRTQSMKDELVEDGVECFEVAVGDIEGDGYVRSPGKSIILNERALEKLRLQVLKPNDIILAVKGSVGRVGLIPADLDVNEPWFANQSFLVLRLKTNPYINDPLVLFRYLSSLAGQSLIRSRVGGATVPIIQTRDVRSLPIIVPSKKEQVAIAAEQGKIATIYEEITKLQAQANELKKKRWTI